MTLHKFAIVVGSDVAGTLTLNDENPDPATPRLIAAFNSDCRIIPMAPEQEDVAFGWSYDGEEFIAPPSFPTGE
jgi:hypothetical protein